MESKKINQLATEMSPAISDLTIIGDPITGVSKKITLLQIADLFQTTGTVTSVAVTESGNALSITGSPITTAGTINIGFAGSANQYVRGDGALAPFPTSTGGGSSVSYYLNGSVNQGTFGGSTYYQMSKDAVIGVGTNFSTSSNGLIAQFITDANDPDVVQIPSGNWNIEFFMNVSASSGALASFYVEIYKYNGSTFTLLATNSATPEELTNTTTVDAYYTSVAMPTSALSVTDRLAIRIYANVASKTVTLYTEDNRLCQVVTTFSKGMSSLNNLTDQSQFLATGTSGTDFAIVSSGDTHTFNLPVASATNTGKLSNTDWSTFNNKQAALSFTAPLVNTSNTISIPAATSLVDGYLDNLDWVNFNTAYNNMIVSAAVTGTTTKTLTLTQQDAGTITASWTDDNTDAVTSVFGRTGAVVAQSGDYTTTQVTEGTNLYFTDARARGALSFAAGSGAYNSTTGVITIPTNTNQLTNGASFITLGSLSGGTGISYNSTTGVITNSAPDQNVVLTAGAGISISGTYPSFTIASTITQYTDALARASISLTTTGTSGAATYNSTTGVFNIPNYGSALSGYLPLTGGTLTGGLSGTTLGLSGALTGTTANFSSTLKVNSAAGSLSLDVLSTSQYDGIRVYNTSSSQGADIRVGNDANNNLGFLRVGGSASGGIYQNSLVLGTGGGYDVKIAPNGSLGLTVANGGAATFSSSVTALSANFTNSVGGQILKVEGPSTADNFISVLSGSIHMFLDADMTNSAGIVGTQSNHPLIFRTNGTNKSRINTNGNLLINTISDDGGSKLQIDGNIKLTGSSTILRLDNTGGTAQSWWVGQDVAGTNDGIFYIFNATSATQAINIRKNNNVLIGTTTDAGFKLDVNGTGRIGDTLTINTPSSATSIALRGRSTDNFSALRFQSNSGASTYATIYSNASDLIVENGGSPRLTLSNSGNFGINTLTPETLLEIYRSSSGDAIILSAPIDTGFSNYLAWNHSKGRSLISARIGTVDDGNYGGNIVFQNRTGLGTTTSEKMRIRTDGIIWMGTTTGITGGGLLQVNGNVNINGVFQINGVTIGGGGGSGVTGAGTTGYHSKWTSSTSLGNGILYDDGTRIGLNTTSALTATRFQIDYSGAGNYGIFINQTTANEATMRFKSTHDANSDYRIGASITIVSAFEIYSTNAASTRFAVASNGNILINRITDAGYKLDVNGTGRFTGDVTTANIIAGGSVTASSGFFDTSDSRLKIVIKDYNQAKGIEKVQARLYLKNNKKELGYFAQDIQEILPSAVAEGADGFLTLSYSQVHTAKIAYLEKEIAELKELIKSLL